MVLNMVDAQWCMIRNGVLQQLTKLSIQPHARIVASATIPLFRGFML